MRTPPVPGVQRPARIAGLLTALLLPSLLLNPLPIQAQGSEPAAPATVPAAVALSYDLVEAFAQRSFPALIADFQSSAALTAEQQAAFRRGVHDAVMRHPSLQAGLARWSESRSARSEIGGELWPQIYAGLGGEKTLTERPGTTIPSDMNSNLYVQISQVLFDAGAIFRRLEAADSRAEAQRLAARLSAQTLSLRALSAYYDVARSARKLALAEANLARHRMLLQMIGESVAGKVSARSDLLRAQGREADALATLAALQGELERARAVWREYHGDQPPPTQIPLLRPELPSDDASAMVRLRAGNLELARLDQLAVAATRDFDAEKAKLFPRVAVQVTGRQFQLDRLAERDNEVVGAVQLSYPLFTGGSQSARREQAANRVGATRSDVDSLRSELEREVRAALSNVASQTQRLHALDLSLRAEEETILAFLEQFRIGRRSLADLLDAQRDLFNASIARVDGAVALELAHYTVAAGLGELLVFFDLDKIDTSASLP